MNKNLKCMAYNREKKVTISFGGVTQQVTLVALSAKDNAAALTEAQKVQTETVKLLPGMAESIRTVCLLQDMDALVEGVLQTEYEQLLHKAALTLVEGDLHYDEKLAAKAEAVKLTRRSELAALTKEQLADKMVSSEVNRQLNLAWNCAVMDAIIVRMLHGDDGLRLFLSVEHMKETLPAEVLVKLYDAMNKFLSERENAQVFPEPHTSNG